MVAATQAPSLTTNLPVKLQPGLQVFLKMKITSKIVVRTLVQAQILMVFLGLMCKVVICMKSTGCVLGATIPTFGITKLTIKTQLASVCQRITLMCLKPMRQPVQALIKTTFTFSKILTSINNRHLQAHRQAMVHGSF